MEISKNFNALNLNKKTLLKPYCGQPVQQKANNSNTNSELMLNSTNKYLVNFKGLNKTLSKTAYSFAICVKDEVDNFPKSNGVAGNLPSEWVKKIPKENREAAIKELYKDFKGIITDFRQDDDKGKIEKRLGQAFIKAGIVSNDEKIKLKRLGSGVYGTGYRLKGISDDKYMIKVFNSNDTYSNKHGNFIELNRAAYWQKHAGKNTQMVPFYFGDADAGYMVNKYIDKNDPKCKKYVNPEIYGLKSNDVGLIDDPFGHNKISGFQIDYGGISVEQDELVKNKEKQFFVKKFLALPADKQIHALATADDEVKIIALRKLSHCPESERFAYFNKILENSSNRIKTALAIRIALLQENERVIVFKKLTENSNDEVKSTLSNCLRCLPQNEIPACFNHLIENSGTKVKASLAYKFGLLSENERLSNFIRLAKNADDELKIALVNNIYALPEAERTTAFNQFVIGADEKVNMALVKNIFNLPENQRTPYLMDLAKTGGESVKIELSKKICCMPDENRAEYFSHLAKDAGVEAKKALSKIFAALPDEDREACRKLV